MSIEVGVKREPLDAEDVQEMAQQQQQQQQFSLNKIKVEPSEVAPFDDDNIRIVDERENIITVSAGDLKSEDELHFIEALHKPESLQFCPVCPLLFDKRQEFLVHLGLHQQNRFFCSQPCGNHFETLQQCEEHEFRKHFIMMWDCNICWRRFPTCDQRLLHMNSHNKMRRFACCFCRECFKSELQLHIHWLGPSHRCGRRMQDVAEAISAQSRSGQSTGGAMPSVPFTRIRLKSSLAQAPASAPPDKVTKKRCRVEKRSAERDGEAFRHRSIKIKKEPQEVKEILSDHSKCGASFIKAEPLEMVEVKKEPEEINEKNEPQSAATQTSAPPPAPAPDPDPDPDPAPSPAQAATANVNADLAELPESIRNLPNIKIVKLSGAATSAPPPQKKPPNTAPLKPNGNVKFLTLPLQIIKLSSNTQLLTLSKVHPTRPTPLKVAPTKPPIYLKLKPVEQKSVGTDSGEKLSQSAAAPSKPAVVTIKLSSLSTNTTIDAEDFKKLQVEALQKVEEAKKNKVISHNDLLAIESRPEKRKLIENMMEQIKKAENGESPSNSPTSPLQTDNSSMSLNDAKDLETDSVAERVPASMFLPVSSSYDEHVYSARRLHPDYRFSWQCPSCTRLYEQKHAFRTHLMRTHELSMRDLDKLVVEVKATRIGENGRVPYRRISTTSSITPPLQAAFPITSSVSSSGDSTGEESIKMSALKSNRNRYTCEKCGRTCSSKTMLNDHILANCSREPQYACTKCPKKFFSAGTLNCHLTIHTGVLPHKCDYCEKRFRTRGQVTVHHRTHTGEKPFVCQVCSQSFTHRETLIAHLSRHIGMKRYKCYGCQKLFSCISALKTHRDIRPDTCGKVKFNPRAVGPRVRVVRGNVIFEPQPEINPYLRTEDPKVVLAELQNQQQQQKQQQQQQ